MVRRNSWIIGLFVLTLSCSASLTNRLDTPAGFELAETPVNSLTVLSYNVFLRPNLLSLRDYPQCRGAGIGDWLNTIDAGIVALQETWDKEGVTLLADRAVERFPFQVLGKPERYATKNFTGGLSILSRWPIERVRTHVYGACFLDDCRSSKGVLHAVVRLSRDHRVQIVTTHLNAGGSGAARRARAAQLDELAAFIESLDADHGPVIIAGDFNIDSLDGNGEYQRLLRTLNVNDTAPREPSTLNCKTNATCKSPEAVRRLDYIFTYPTETRLARTGTQHLPVETEVCKGAIRYLSDHRAVSATFSTHLQQPVRPETTRL